MQPTMRKHRTGKIPLRDAIECFGAFHRANQETLHVLREIRDTLRLINAREDIGNTVAISTAAYQLPPPRFDNLIEELEKKLDVYRA